jgi:RNA polymerase sigma-70 factor (ECF subfamily)
MPRVSLIGKMHEIDLTVVSRVQAGETDAFGLLVERHSQSVFRAAYRITGNETEADEIVQETFLRAYREIQRYESRASFSTWIHTIARNLALDSLRKNKPGAPDLELVSPAPTPERLATSQLLGERISEAMKQLSPHERAAFTMRHYDGTPLVEIGESLGLSENATKQSIFRAVRKLRRALLPWVTLA